ncbi:hypothetical protein EVAR_58572_1 [Eumeta japonica]|uniref:Uncharacterized protein n=1 Tax=Eumeta variegata TaxID=151549 RepID=A0A4C1Z1P3_EUMVA|nr:hypothetical protein EVAR_58572_1 [Eumeta japonica]
MHCDLRKSKGTREELAVASRVRRYDSPSSRTGTEFSENFNQGREGGGEGALSTPILEFAIAFCVAKATPPVALCWPALIETKLKFAKGAPEGSIEEVLASFLFLEVITVDLRLRKPPRSVQCGLSAVKDRRHRCNENGPDPRRNSLFERLWEAGSAWETINRHLASVAPPGLNRGSRAVLDKSELPLNPTILNVPSKAEEI